MVTRMTVPKQAARERRDSKPVRNPVFSEFLGITEDHKVPLPAVVKNHLSTSFYRGLVSVLKKEPEAMGILAEYLKSDNPHTVRRAVKAFCFAAQEGVKLPEAICNSISDYILTQYPAINWAAAETLKYAAQSGSELNGHVTQNLEMVLSSPYADPCIVPEIQEVIRELQKRNSVVVPKE